MQRYLLWCVFAGSSLELKIETDGNDVVEINTEADSPCDDMPSFGMFAFNIFAVYLHIL